MKIGIDVRCFAHGKRTGVEGYAQHMLEALFQNDQHNEYILFFNALLVLMSGDSYGKYIHTRKSLSGKYR